MRMTRNCLSAGALAAVLVLAVHGVQAFEFTYVVKLDHTFYDAVDEAARGVCEKEFWYAPLPTNLDMTDNGDGTITVKDGCTCTYAATHRNLTDGINMPPSGTGEATPEQCLEMHHARTLEGFQPPED